MSCVDILSVPVSLVILFFLSLSYTFLPSFRPLPSIRFQLRRALVTSTTYTPSSPQQPSSTTPTTPTTPPTASRRSDSKPIRRPANLLPTSLRPPLPQRRAVQYSTTAAVPTSSTEIEIEMDYPSHPLHHPTRGSSRPSRRLSTASTSLSTSHLLPSLSPPSANPFSPSSSHALAHSHGGLSLVAAGISTGPHSRFASSGGPTQPPTLHPLPHGHAHNHLHHQNPYPTRPSASEIIPNRLYISDLSFAENPALLSSYRITHILSTMPDKIFAPPPSLLPVQPKRMQVCIEDSPFAELASFLPGTTAWIREALGPASLPSASTSTPPPSSSSSSPSSTANSMAGAYEPRVLVHCAEGISRSVSVVAAYLMATYNWSVDEALLFVKSKRRIAEPNFGFVQQLHEYARDGLGRTNGSGSGSGSGMSMMGGASSASSGSALGYGVAGQMNVFSGGPGAGGGGFSSFGAFGQ